MGGLIVEGVYDDVDCEMGVVFGEEVFVVLVVILFVVIVFVVVEYV